ncbi:MAG: hypothetical protein KGM24_06115 [Elusimicrobia bacterium]|nr:hypothetical protein [Elusimicrobiota bacterium]
MLRLNRRGDVLLHVVVTGAIVALISALVLRMAMMRYGVTARARQATTDLRDDQGVLNAALSTWAANSGNVCSGAPTATGVACNGGCSTNSCGCSCLCKNGTVELDVSCPAPTGSWPACGQCTTSIKTLNNLGGAPF